MLRGGLNIWIAPPPPGWKPFKDVNTLWMVLQMKALLKQTPEGFNSQIPLSVEFSSPLLLVHIQFSGLNSVL